ncbi:pyridoxal-phosphate dependent enzyme [Taibaiella lutea]|uniref:Pyridoxal-phosphate dependent enzyme n=1 Tax=Taibaiella lutea TaxID=2608001 RepID=A0A5M6CPC8_9BACT|nr:pyridoxal-phosphate dependent enzyme [Taibaiella lutea]KAA5536957.1 pyridoxal-phosphate dependent enzyme [Taibaiella lutea]
MDIDFQAEIKIDVLEDEILQARGIELGILRLDQIHPVVSGNKWFKLKYNIAEAVRNGSDSILTFGGAFSNHLIATAAAAKAFGLSSIGIVRGFHAENNLSETLHACINMGMQLHFISRGDYSQKDTDAFLNTIAQQFPQSFIIPEGGDNEKGRKGTAEITALIPDTFTHIVLPVGTGATFSGIRNALPGTVEMLGFTAMKGGGYLEEAIKKSLKSLLPNWDLITDYHFGGFAKYNQSLIDFMNAFYEKFRIPLDMVYTSKMMYGIFDLIKSEKFPEGSKILCIHTGGLQGNHSIKHLLSYK